MKKILCSYYTSFFVLIIGLLFFAIICPEIPYQDNFYRTLIGFFSLAFAIPTFHFIWVMKTRLSKNNYWYFSCSILTLIFLNILFLTSQTGNRLQKHIEAKINRKASPIKQALASYYHDQCSFWKTNHSFSRDLHKNLNIDKVDFATVEESALLAENCDDCVINNQNFKLAGITFIESHIVFVILDGQKCKAGNGSIEVKSFPVKVTPKGN